MIDRDHILLPVNPAFIGFSLVAAFFMNLFPWGGWGWVPDFVALTLIFWSIYQPRKVGIGIAFLMGLVMDVHSASLLGENLVALAADCGQQGEDQQDHRNDHETEGERPFHKDPHGAA